MNSSDPTPWDALVVDVEASGCAAEDLEAYYDAGKKEYLMRNASLGWVSLPEAGFKRRLRSIGISTKPGDGSLCSPADIEIMRIQDYKAVHYAAPLAGYREGFRDMDGFRVLVTESPRFIDPKPGSWDTLRRTFEAVLRDEQHDQLAFLYGWLKVAIISLQAESFQPGQALAIAGPAGCGKSLLQALFTQLLGGRAAKPYQFMTGSTPFNSDLFRAEHLMIEDEAPSSDYRARRNLGSFIKQLTVNQEQRLHAKGRDALMLKPFWRVSITLNDEPEDLHVLPPIDAGLEDKLILLRAYKRPLPMPTQTQTQTPNERAAFWKALTGELPAFADWLLNQFDVPEALKCQRFGIAHFHHPDLLRSLHQLSNEALFLELIDQHSLAPFTGTAAEIESILRNQCAPRQLEKLLCFRGATGTYLQRLSKSDPDRVKKKRTTQNNQWEIFPLTDADPSTPSTDWA